MFYVDGHSRFATDIVVLLKIICAKSLVDLHVQDIDIGS